MPVDPSIPPPLDPTLRMADRLRDLERRLAAVEAREGVPVVTALPAAGREGRILRVAGTVSGSGVFVDTGTTWVAL